MSPEKLAQNQPAMTNNFKELKVWQKAMQLTKESYRVTKAFPESERFGLTSQLNRSAVSVAANIAEGAGRKSKKEFAHFLSVSNGSCYEFETLAIIARENAYVDETDFDNLTQLNTEVQKMLNRLMESLGV